MMLTSKKCSFSLRISSANVTKSLKENFIFVQCMIHYINPFAIRLLTICRNIGDSKEFKGILGVSLEITKFSTFLFLSDFRLVYKRLGSQFPDVIGSLRYRNSSRRICTQAQTILLFGFSR